MLVTTAYRPDAPEEAYARSIAERLGALYVARGNRSLARLSQTYGDGELLVVSGRELRYYSGPEADPVFFHPSMAAVRIKRLQKGERDRMLEACGLESGDAVLDCTAGMASDAIVFSYAAGPEGEVTALESEPVTALLVREGLAHYTSDLPALSEAMRRIRLIQADHLDMLKRLPSGRYDIVYFDPMFRSPVEESAWLAPLRPLANPEPLRPEAVREAVRVARKCVVMKERRGSGEFERLGFTPVFRSGATTDYGVIRK